MLDVVRWLARSTLALVVGAGGLITIAASLASGKHAAALLGLGMIGVAWLAWPRRPNSWRSDPPTDRQLAYAEDLGIAVPPGATKGLVSDLISAAKGR